MVRDQRNSPLTRSAHEDGGAVAASGRMGRDYTGVTSKLLSEVEFCHLQVQVLKALPSP